MKIQFFPSKTCIVKTHWQCMSLREKTEFSFFVFPIFQYCLPKTRHACCWVKAWTDWEREEIKAASVKAEDMRLFALSEYSWCVVCGWVRVCETERVKLYVCGWERNSVRGSRELARWFVWRKNEERQFVRMRDLSSCSQVHALHLYTEEYTATPAQCECGKLKPTQIKSISQTISVSKMAQF